MKKAKLPVKSKDLDILKQAVNFHGHLGPYLVLGLLIGDVAMKKLKCKKHFEIRSVVKGANKKPKSCLIDGIQLSTGCTYGKGNIEKAHGGSIEAHFFNLKNDTHIRICLKKELIENLEKLKDHDDSELLAKKILKMPPVDLFETSF